MSGGPDAPDDNQRKHMEFVQAIVIRMAGASSNAKAWLLPVVAATYGYALTKNAESVALLGVAAVAIFMMLDANYLRQERAYRRLYDAVAAGSPYVPTFSLDPRHATTPLPPATTRWRRICRLARRWFPDRTVWLSWSIMPFYGALLLVGIAIILRLAYVGS